MDSIAIEPITSIHIGPLSLFHLENLAGHLSGLGLSCIRQFYGTVLCLDDAWGWIASREGHIEGFVLGSLDGNTLWGRALRQDPIGWVMASAQSFFRHPVSFCRTAWDVALHSPPAHASSTPELHYIAVQPRSRGHSIGRHLLQRLCQELLARGKTRFEFSVGRDNEQALRFYQGLGARALQDYQTGGVVMTRFSCEAKTVIEKGRFS